MSILQNTDYRNLVLCFQVHQPRRIKKVAVGEPASGVYCLDDSLDEEIMKRVATHCYVPTNVMLLRLIEKYPQIKIAFSISGTALGQMEAYAPKALDTFKSLASTGSVDFLSEPYYHSLAFLMESEEFEIQILEHAEKIHEHFEVRPTVFRNTNMIYNDDIGRRVSMMGFNGVLTEGNPHLLKQVSPHYVYEHRDLNGLKLLLRNSSLSDDIAFRVATTGWNITAEKYMSWLEAMPENERLVVLSLDYETFGEHQKPETGIFEFLEHLLLLLAMQPVYKMNLPSEIIQNIPAHRPLSIPDYIAVGNFQLADWVGNDKQREAFSSMTGLESLIKKRNDPQLLKQWRCLQASDHFYYMSDKADRAGHLSPYSSSQAAFHYYINAINCISRQLLEEANAETDPEKINEAMEAERRNLNTPLWALNIDPNKGYSG